nr:GNAT family N-acetyltransferase [uncultured Pseudomonas sp.]
MIRIAEAIDEPDIRQCADQAYARYVSVIGRKPAPMVADYVTQIAAGVVYVAADDQGRFQGFIVFYVESGYALLENVAVLPSEAGRGVGKSLIGFCEDDARGRGLSAVRLYTNAAMSDNLAIYPRLGYVKVAERREDGFNRVFFEKNLV